MIDYSVFMMGNPMDVDAAQKAYAKAQVSEIMPFSQFVKHIADHNGVFTRGTVKGVIADMCECLVEMLLEGKKVQLAELGNFWISIGSEGAEDLKKFTESNITAVNIVFTPGEDFQNLRSRAAFNPVASRIAQAATLKAEKAGKGTVDLNAAKGKTRLPRMKTIRHYDKIPHFLDGKCVRQDDAQESIRKVCAQRNGFA